LGRPVSRGVRGLTCAIAERSKNSQQKGKVSNEKKIKERNKQVRFEGKIAMEGNTLAGESRPKKGPT